MAATRLMRPLEWMCLAAEWPPAARGWRRGSSTFVPSGNTSIQAWGLPEGCRPSHALRAGSSLQQSRPSGDSDSRTTVSGTGKCTSRAVGFDSVESESDSQGQPCHHDSARLSLSFGHQMSYGLETTKPVTDRQQPLLPAGTILTCLQALGTHRHSLSQPNVSTQSPLLHVMSKPSEVSEAASRSS